MTSARRPAALVIGAGQIGRAIAHELLDDYDVHVHCRRRSSVEDVARELGLGPERLWSGELVVGHGDLVGPEQVWPPLEEDPDLGSWNRFATLLRETNAELVVDATNVATTVASVGTDRTMIEGTSVGSDAALGHVSGHLQGKIQALHEALRRRTQSYVRVSTTGTGRRGIDVPFTHGDSNSFMSPNLWLKLMIAGMEHQALWALARTYPGRVVLVVPASFVGFEAVDDESCLVGAGEGLTYSEPELAVISSEHQMGTVTAAEVAAVARRAAGGERAHDLLAALSDTTIGPSVEGFRRRAEVLVTLRSGRNAGDPPRLAGSLGPRTSRALLLIEAWRATCPGPLRGLLVPSHEAPTPPADVVEDLCAEAARVGVEVLAHDRTSTSRTLCLCPTCLGQLRDEVFGTVDELRSGGAVDVEALLDQRDWSAGDLLALLWEGARVDASCL